MKLKMLFLVAAIVTVPNTVFAAWSCDCATNEWYEDGSEAILVAEGETKEEAIQVCKKEMNGRVVPDSCQSLGRGDR